MGEQKITDKLKSKMMNELRIRLKYSFLDLIITKYNYPVFEIKEERYTPSVLEEKCHQHGSEGPESFSDQFYSVDKGEMFELAQVYGPGGETLPQEPSPKIKEELLSKRINPKFLVRVRVLKYEIKTVHHHDISLSVYNVV